MCWLKHVAKLETPAGNVIICKDGYLKSNEQKWVEPFRTSVHTFKDCPHLASIIAYSKLIKTTNILRRGC